MATETRKDNYRYSRVFISMIFASLFRLGILACFLHYQPQIQIENICATCLG